MIIGHYDFMIIDVIITDRYGIFTIRGINYVLSALVFNVVPTIFEVSLVTGIMVTWICCMQKRMATDHNASVLKFIIILILLFGE